LDLTFDLVLDLIFDPDLSPLPSCENVFVSDNGLIIPVVVLLDSIDLLDKSVLLDKSATSDKLSDDISDADSDAVSDAVLSDSDAFLLYSSDSESDAVLDVSDSDAVLLDSSDSDDILDPDVEKNDGSGSDVLNGGISKELFEVFSDCKNCGMVSDDFSTGDPDDFSLDDPDDFSEDLSDAFVLEKFRLVSSGNFKNPSVSRRLGHVSSNSFIFILI
jgi:hypothetical protein